MMKEIWKDIKGYKGLYRASNKGRFKSLRTGRIMSPTFYKRTKGNAVNILGLIDKKGINRSFVASRIIADLFIPNPDPAKYNVVNCRGDWKNLNPKNWFWTSHSRALRKYWKPRVIRKKVHCKKCAKIFTVRRNAERKYCSIKCSRSDQIGKVPNWTKYGKFRMVTSKHKPVIGTLGKEKVIFNSLQDAAEFINRNPSGISNAIAGRQWACAGWRFRFKK